MRLSPLNIIMHKSIIWLEQHTKQDPPLTFTEGITSDESRRKYRGTQIKKSYQMTIISSVLIQRRA